MSYAERIRQAYLPSISCGFRAITLIEFVAACSKGCPEDFVASLWHRAIGRANL